MFLQFHFHPEDVPGDKGVLQIQHIVDFQLAALQKRLSAEGLCADRETGTARFFVSCETAPFDAFASRYLDLGPVHAAELVPMEL